MKLFLIIAAILASLFFAIRSQKTITNKPSFSPIKALATVEEKEVSSLDSTKRLIMKSERQTDGSHAYSFTIIDTTKKSERSLFTKTLLSSGSMVLPENSWEPDDSYVFVQENDADGLHYLVFKASGEPFTEGVQYLDVTPLFVKAQPSLRLRDVTGWDGPDLLHVSTTTDQGAKGPSFWFVVSTRAFLQLAR